MVCQHDRTACHQRRLPELYVDKVKIIPRAPPFSKDSYRQATDRLRYTEVPIEVQPHTDES